MFISAVGCLPEAAVLQHVVGPEDTCSSLWPVTLLSLIRTASGCYVILVYRWNLGSWFSPSLGLLQKANTNTALLSQPSKEASVWVTLIWLAICYGVPFFVHLWLGCCFWSLQHFVLHYSEVQFRMPVVNHDRTFKKNCCSFKKVKCHTAVFQGTSLRFFLMPCVFFHRFFFSSLLVVINTVLVLYLYNGKMFGLNFAVTQTQYKCLRPLLCMWYSTVPEMY